MTTRTKPSALTWFVSVRSPYSWLAIHDARERYPREWESSSLGVFFEPGEVTLSVVSDESRVQLPYRTMSRDKHLYILRDVRRLALDRGLEVSWPVDRDPCWEVSSLALLTVVDREPEAAHALAWELATCRWQRGGDISQPEVVARCLRACGLNERLAWAWQEFGALERGVEEIERVNRLGVFGVPYLLVDREPYWGLDRLDPAIRAWGERPDPVETPTELVSVGVDGHAGGCG